MLLLIIHKHFNVGSGSNKSPEDPKPNCKQDPEGKPPILHVISMINNQHKKKQIKKRKGDRRHSDTEVLPL